MYFFLLILILSCLFLIRAAVLIRSNKFPDFAGMNLVFLACLWSMAGLFIAIDQFTSGNTDTMILHGVVSFGLYFVGLGTFVFTTSIRSEEGMKSGLLLFWIAICLGIQSSFYVIMMNNCLFGACL